LMERLWSEYGLTMVLVTHDSSIARRAQRIGLMQNGKLSIRKDTRPARVPAPSEAPASSASPAPAT
jgi:putative ABC transport system ATP-binding protein